MNVAGSVVNLCQQVWLLIHIIRYAKDIVYAIQAVVEVHGEIIRQSSFLIPLHMRCRCQALQVESASQGMQCSCIACTRTDVVSAVAL